MSVAYVQVVYPDLNSSIVREVSSALSDLLVCLIMNGVQMLQISNQVKTY